MLLHLGRTYFSFHVTILTVWFSNERDSYLNKYRKQRAHRGMAGPKGRLVPLVFLALLVLHGTVSPQTLRDDEQHLFAFLQNVLPGFPFPFNFTVPTCQWEGVSCIGLGLQQRFYRLSFSGLGLNGTIPYSSLGALTALSILDLSNNFLTGDIPYDIFTLPNLMQLELSNNRLNGSLPQWLNLFQLQKLNLSGNRLNGSIPDTFGYNLKSLKYLNLHGNNFSGPIPVLQNSKFLNYLDVSSNQFTGGLPFAMFLITELGFLNVSRNLLSGPVPAEFNWLWKMRILDLSENKFVGSLPDLYNLGQLTGFYVSSNSLNGSLPSNLTRLPTLQALDVHSNFLTGSLPSMVSPISYLDCRNNYFNGSLPLGLLASENLAVVLLGRNQFTGPIPTNLTIHIQEMDLTSNQFNGSIPWSSITKLEALERLSLAQNWFAKEALPIFSQMLNLTFLNLSSCNVNGSIPDSVGDLQSLLQLDLSHNQITGNIPTNFSRTINMTSLDLSHNDLMGEIPRELVSLPRLSRVDLSFNNLSGEVPFENQWRFFTNSSFEGNALLCGIVLNKVCQGLVSSPTKSPLPAPFLAPETPVIVPPVRPRHDSNGVGAGTVLGIVIGLALALCAFLVTYIVFHKKHKYKKARTRKENAIYLTGSVTFEADPSAWASQVPQPASIPVIMFEKPLLNLTFADLFQATSKFHKDSQIADGRYGPSFKGVLPGGFQIVVKVLYDGGPANELEKAAQLEALGKIRHENLVSLVGYCLVGEERLLVYEFMENGDLHQRLHDSLEESHHPDNWTKETWADANEKFPVSEDLSWPIRHRVAVGVARALAFLHHGCVPNVVHRDVTSANIMLDSHYEPHISDCGLAELVETGKRYETTPVTGGTLGYVPPEYSQLCKATARGDVYSFGVVLLELVTGRRPTGEYYHENYGGNLVGWVRTLIRDKRGFKCLDPKLLSSGVESEMLEALRIGYLCTAELPSKRPTMQQVVGLLKDIHVDVVTCM